MKYSDMRPNRHSRRPAKDAAAAAPSRPDVGPRPLSARQRAYHADAVASGRALPGERRSVSAKRLHASPARRRNRRRRDIPRLLLRLSLAALLIECVAVLLFSPHLWVRSVRIEGNQTVAAARLYARLRLSPRTNLVTLPTARLRAAIEKEPVVARAQVFRRWPDTVVVAVRERQAWAAVKASGVWYTIDETLVPFRKGALPEPDLPLIVLETGEGAAPALGKQLLAPGIREASSCLLWAALRDDLPLEKVGVDQSGKLCLNREGGAEIRLGSGMDLDEKLNTLATLLARREDLREGDFAYINLFAFDAPAILPRSSTPDAETRRASENRPRHSL